MEIIRYAELKPTPLPGNAGTSHRVASADGWSITLNELRKTMDLATGSERLVTVVDGELLLLTLDGQDHPLEKNRAFRIPAAATAQGSLPTGDIRFLSVATDASFRGYTSIIEISKKRAHPVFAGQFAVLLQGQASVTAGGEEPTEETAAEALNRWDAVVGSDTASPEILGRGFLAVVSIDAVNS